MLISAAVVVVWTASVAAWSAAASTGAHPAHRPMQVTASVPAAPIEAPATPTIVGQVAPAMTPASAVSSGANAGGIPSIALAAYQRAQTILAGAAPACHLPWSLLAAIGKVESDHGRFGGNALDASGTATPGIFGIPLDGTNGTQAVPATDPVLDGGSPWERAVGPMQFLPSSWKVVGVDTNGDGKRDPQNIFDAAAGAGVYLCSGHGDLSTPDGASAAVLRYNHSQDYVNVVMALAQQYAAGNFSAVPSGIPAPSASPTPSPSSAPAPAASAPSSSTPKASSSPSATSSPAQSASPSPTPLSSGLNSGLGGTTCKPALGGLLTGPAPASCTPSP